MRNPPPLPDLGKLTNAQKDELIVSLWETLVVTEAAAENPIAAAPRETVATGQVRQTRVEDLRGRLLRSAPSGRLRTQSVAHPLHRGLDLLDSKLLLGVLIAIGVGFLADAGIGWYQQRMLAARNRAALALENAAFGGLNVELSGITYESDGKSYRASFDMQNGSPSDRLYVMLSAVRVFVQAGLTWQEVPAQVPGDSDRGVVALDDGRAYQAVFQTDTKDWAELIPGYMHVRIESDMLISRSSEPKDDIIERDNRFYVYLKPQGADDAAIRRRTNFPGGLPIFIPMPPH